ncbi:helix-turn-helix domain-containing protein [Arvimicrobium flavum]|uniref:helix-turn-helix domain-containing protein n=1 Tax=Arvimicrobium flavum TaxID=3393320 RepID=UPI00237B85BA|nr:helix-turn-helix domain-containing protein [Mesorhizobium shangrilense]
MTPFGQKLRELRRQRGIAQKDMAAALGVSAAYLSALEHGHRGQPSWPFVQKVIGYFNIIWDDADELENLAWASDPRVVVDTSGLSPQATRLANLLARDIGELDEEALRVLIAALESAKKR